MSTQRYFYYSVPIRVSNAFISLDKRNLGCWEEEPLSFTVFVVCGVYAAKSGL